MKLSWITSIAVTVTLAIAGVYTAQGHEGKSRCTNSSLRGSYGLLATGTIIGVGPFAAVGVLVFDGNGNLSGTLSEQINGNTFQNDTFTGNYTVDRFCRVSDTWRFTTGETSQHDSVLVNGGNEFYILNTTPAAVISGTAKKIFGETD